MINRENGKEQVLKYLQKQLLYLLLRSIIKTEMIGHPVITMIIGI